MADRLRIFIGRYTEGDSSPQPAPGITVADFDPDSLTVTPLTGAQLPEASFLALSPSGDVLYAAREEDTGAVAAFRVDGASAELTPLGERTTDGSYPCHLTVDASGRYLLTANYMSGNVAVHPIEPGGRLGELSDLAQHTGSGPQKDRQEGPHAHMATPAPSGDAYLVADLGTDTVYAYTFDDATGRLALIAENRMRPGTGPRHLVFHPSGEYFYLANELSNTVSVCSYDAANGSAYELIELGCVPDSKAGESFPSGIQLSPNARFVYVANRGDESISAFEVGDEGARLIPIGRWPCGGSWPRHITLSPDGRFLFSANQRSHNIAVFRVDALNGELTPTDASFPIRQPAHVLFTKAEQPAD
jgi:6-phosphogluconolactonase